LETASLSPAIALLLLLLLQEGPVSWTFVDYNIGRRFIAPGCPFAASTLIRYVGPFHRVAAAWISSACHCTVTRPRLPRSWASSSGPLYRFFYSAHRGHLQNPACWQTTGCASTSTALQIHSLKPPSSFSPSSSHCSDKQLIVLLLPLHPHFPPSHLPSFTASFSSSGYPQLTYKTHISLASPDKQQTWPR